MASNDYLNALIDCLDSSAETSNDDDESSPDRVENVGEHLLDGEPADPRGAPIEPVEEPQIGLAAVDQPLGPEQVGLQTPPRRRPLSVLKYIRSSSAKRQSTKQTHCQFCQLEVSKEEMENHLTEAQECQILYLRTLHVKNVPAILCMLFDCLYCQERTSKLFLHLQSSENCQIQYLQRFGVESSREVCAKVQALKRPARASRRKLSRELENSKASAKKKAKLKTEPQETFLNQHHTNIVFSNYRKCIHCHADLMTAEMIDAESSVIQDGKHSLEGKDELKRLENFWLCSSCKNVSGDQELKSLRNPTYQMVKVRHQDRTILVPEVKAIGELDNEEGGPNHLEPFETLIMLPSSLQSLAYFEGKIDGISPFEIQQILYGSGGINEKTLSLVYQHQLSKYDKVKNYSDSFVGRISDVDQRQLASVSSSASDSQIVGSSHYRQTQQDDVHWKVKMIGPWCVQMTVKFPYPLEMSVATAVLQEGRVMSVSFTGDSQELKKTYEVHNHDVTTGCVNGTCVKTPLDEYVQDHPVLPSIATFLCSTDSIINSFIANILKTPSSNLESEHFHFQVNFESNGNIILEGIIWPLFMKKLNLSMCDPSTGDEERKQNLQDVVDNLRRSITTTTNRNELKSLISSQDERDIEASVELVRNQVHFCRMECDRCSNAPLPSMEWMVSSGEDAENLGSSLMLLRRMREHFFSMTEEDIRSYTTLQWLESVWDTIEMSELNGELWSIVWGGQEFQFVLTDELSHFVEKYEELLVAGVYHYALKITQKRPGVVILRRSFLLDAFTDPYNLLFKRALNCPMKLKVITSLSDLKFPETTVQNIVSQEASLNHHVPVSISEAFSLLESNRLKIRTSIPVQFIFTGEKQKVYFKKVKEWNENCYQMEGDPAFYERNRTVVDRFVSRMNGRKLLLSEFGSLYDFIGRENSQIQYEVYAGQIEKIKEVDYSFVVDGQDFLPEFILCNGGDVLQIRNKGYKVIKYPEFPRDSFDYKFSEVALFATNEDNRAMTHEYVEEKFNELCTDGAEKIISRNKRIFLQKFRTQ